MRTIDELRADNPDCAFEVRALPQHDGSVYLMALPLWYWHRLEVILMTGDKSLGEINEFCLSLASRAVAEEGWDLSDAFRELFMYYIYRHFQGYRSTRDNLANDNWENCFTHLD